MTNNYKKRTTMLWQKFAFIVCLLSMPVCFQAQTLQLHYALTQDEVGATVVKDETGNNNNATLKNGAKVATFNNNLHVIDLGTDNGYVDMGANTGKIIASLSDFTIHTRIFVPATTSLAGNGNFIWTFSNSQDIASSATGYMFLSAKDSRYSITKTNYNAESKLIAMGTSKTMEQGSWCFITITQKGNTAKYYINETLAATTTISLLPQELGETAYNWIGRACYKNDVYLKNAKIADFRIYDGELSQESVTTLCQDLATLNEDIHRQEIENCIASFEIPQTLRGSLLLPTTIGNNISITWKSSNENVVTPQGTVIRPAIGQPTASVTLTATFKKGNVEIPHEYPVQVIPCLDEAESVAQDLEDLKLAGTENIYQSIFLPYQTLEGSFISWKSSDPTFMNNQGKVMQLSPKGSGKKEITLTATASKGDTKLTRDFTVYIAEDEGYSSYLFAYFTGNSQSKEQICFALSMDGYSYTPLNNGNRIIYSDTIAIKKAVRDPHILRGEDGNTYYMVVTDMKSSEGWSSNDGLVLMKSNDLVNWTHTSIDFPNTWPARFNRQALTQVWAPQTIYDPVAKKYMVYYSIGESGQHYKIYYSYTNDDFTTMTQPQVLYDHGANTIDADIVYKDGLFHMFFKTEQDGNGIQKATATSLQGPWTPNRKDLQQTSVAVEGSGVFKKINSDEWILMYDCYNNGYYEFCSSTDLENFTKVTQSTSSGLFTPRHGTTIPITQEEAERLVAKWPSTALSPTPLGANNLAVRKDFLTINTSSKTILIPVEVGTNLSAFDPLLYGFSGTAISPIGQQDFTNGTVQYTFKMNNTTQTYKVSAAEYGNPVILGFHADPEIMYSEKTGRFYIYPTTDGYSGWAGYSFNVYSSQDLVHWTDEGTMLDLSTSQVPWASGNAWAPCIEEVKVDGDYHYYFYFSGNAGSSKQIGVAVASTPTGPFTDHGSPIISTSPTGGGQQIDVDVFTDPVSGKRYIYWGNNYMAGAELNDDMVSLKAGTTKVMTPSGGSLSTYAYREAPYVFYRNGKYYFLWSVDDTGATNYHVAYGTSTSPLGNITVATNPIVIIQDAANKIYGTGHNAIIQIPGRDEWYIVYHRINANYLSNGPGYHREVCIDRLYFNENGTIKQVTPTHRGIDPVDLSNPGTDIKPVIADDVRTVKEVLYYDLKGIAWGHNEKTLPRGIYIRKFYYTDGSSQSEKFVKLTEY